MQQYPDPTWTPAIGDIVIITTHDDARGHVTDTGGFGSTRWYEIEYAATATSSRRAARVEAADEKDRPQSGRHKRSELKRGT